MKKLILILPVLVCVLSACGPSKEEIEARQQFLNDSFALVMKDSLATIQQQDSTVKKQAVKDSIISTPSHQKHLKEKLVKLEAEYKDECDNLEKIKTHKRLRSKHKKEEQIEKQTEVVENLKKQINTIKKELK